MPKENGFLLADQLEVRRNGNAVTIVYHHPHDDSYDILVDDCPLVLLPHVIKLLQDNLHISK